MFQTIKKTLRATIFLSLHSLSHASAGLHPRDHTPFDYEPLPQSRTFLVEGEYTLLTDLEERVACLGPLKPCTLIALRNTETGETLVVHKYYSNNIHHLLRLVQKRLQPASPAQIQGEIFTARSCDASWELNWRAIHQGRSQTEEVKHLKDMIIEGLGIDDRKQIRAQIFRADKNVPSMEECSLAESSVWIDSQLNIRSTCLLHENVFKMPCSMVHLYKIERKKHQHRTAGIQDQYYGTVAFSQNQMII